MAKEITEGIGEEFYHHYPRIAAVITSNSEGKDNAMAAAWHMPISFVPPIFCVSISAKRCSHKMVMESGKFGVNFLPVGKADIVAGVGATHGDEVDKFSLFKLDTEKETKLGVPVLKDAYAAYECKLINSRFYGDHCLLVGEIIATHKLSEAFDEKGTLDFANFYPVLYVGNDQYMAKDKCKLNYIDRAECVKRYREGQIGG
jgi:flavin reductase (DIM6/NTAB) family NADH-FMN oxidoreductase RutF